MSLAIPGLEALFDLDPATITRAPTRLPAHATPRPRNHPPRPRRDPDHMAQDCAPSCVTCGKPEGRGLCTPKCSTLCAHARNPDRAPLCLVTTRITARLATGLPMARPGRKYAVVDTCPWCARMHWHPARYGLTYRTPPCGTPYLLHLPRPTLATTAPTDPATTARGAAAARTALTTTRHTT